MIVWVNVPDPRGIRKRRPVIIVTGNADLPAAEEIAGVAVTTTFAEPPPAEHVALPWDPLGRSITRLRRRSAAVCNWLVTFAPGDVEAIAGQLPPQTLVEVLRAVARNRHA